MNNQFLKKLTATLLLSVTFAACSTTQSAFTTTDNLSLPAVSIPDKWEHSMSVVALESDQIGWLNRFNDEVLNDLVQQAYTNSPDLKRLQARLDRARAQSRKAKSGLLPVIDGAIGTSRTDGFEGSNNSSANLNVGVDVSWEPDLWGRVGASTRASQFRARAAQSDYEAGQEVLAASVIENYFLAIEANRLAQVSQNNLDALNKTLGFVTVQFDRGLRSGQDISLIRADVASAKVSLNRAEGAARDALRALEILIGAYPNTQRMTVAGLPDVPEFSAIGQPANILTNRPDLEAAQFRVEAAYAAHKSTKAAQKPSLYLGGVIAGSNNRLGQVFDPASMASTLFANLTAPIFDGGSRKADVAIARADIDEAMAEYQDIALTSFREVERQIDQGEILKQQEIELTRALSDARDALKFIQFRYESAEADLLNVLSVQQRVSFIEGQLVSTRRARLVQYINLALSLGVTPNASLN